MRWRRCRAAVRADCQTPAGAPVPLPVGSREPPHGALRHVRLCGCPRSPVTCANAATTSSSRSCAADRTWRRRRPRPCRRSRSARPAGRASSARSPASTRACCRCSRRSSRSRDPGPVTAADLPAALGATDDAGVALVERALRLAVVGTLVYPDTDADADAPLLPSPGLAEILGPYPAGLAPSDAGIRRGHPAGTRRPRRPADAPRRPRPPARARCSTPCCGVRRSASRRPTAPRRPRPSTGCCVATCSCPGDSRHVVLPRAVALALRGGRTHTAPAFPPPLPDDVPHRQPRAGRRRVGRRGRADRAPRRPAGPPLGAGAARGAARRRPGRARAAARGVRRWRPTRRRRPSSSSSPAPRPS